MNNDYNTEFVNWLHGLDDSGEGKQTLARLRQLSVDLDTIMPELIPWVTQVDDSRPALIVAGLYGLTALGGIESDTDANRNLGWSARQLLHDLSPDGDPHGITKHFRSTLDADLDHLLINLRWFFQMFRLHGVPVNWLLFMNAMTEWDTDRDQPLTKSVRMQWSRAFWGSEPDADFTENKND